MIMLIKLFFISARLKIAKELSYRADFISGTVASMLYALIGPLTQYFIFINTNGFPGWNINQVLLFQGIVLLFFGIRDMMFGEIQTTVQTLVEKGEFDIFLLKPFSTSGVLLTSGFRFSNIFVCQIRVGVFQLLLFFLSLAASLVLYMAFILFCSALIIVFVKIGRITEIIEALLRFSQYPVQILPSALRVSFLVFFPLAIFAYIPAQILLRRLEAIAYMGFVVCIILFYLAKRTFYSSIRKYTSAGG